MAFRTVLITGAAGNLGRKLRLHLESKYDLRLLDVAGGDGIIRADLGTWSAHWVEQLRGVDTVVHLAADPRPTQTWPNLVAPNIDAMVNVFSASALTGVRRVVFASSNHVMGGYKDRVAPGQLTTDLPPVPGTAYHVNGQVFHSDAYAATKLMGERVGKCFAEVHGLSVIAVRIGWIKPGENAATSIPPERGEWFRLMWISNRDFCRLMECCITATPNELFVVAYGMSRNAGMPWNLASTMEQLGFEPLDDVTTASGSD